MLSRFAYKLVFPSRSIVGLDSTVYLICCIQVAVELVLQSLVCFLLVFYLVPLKFLWNGLFLAYLKVDWVSCKTSIVQSRRSPRMKIFVWYMHG